MDLDLLRTFLEVYRTRHFRVAGDNLHVTQSTVSARIRLLEETLGNRLFDRARGNLQPTPAGVRLLGHAEQILTQWARACQALKPEGAQEVLIIVGAAASLWDSLLQPWLAQVYRHETALAFRVQSHAPEQLVRRLGAGALDLIFTYEPPPLPQLISHTVARLALCLVSTRPGDSLDQALGLSFMAVDWGTSIQTRLKRESSAPSMPRFEFSHGRNALNLILECGGSAYLPEPLVKPWLDRGRLHAVAHAPVIQREVYACYAADHPHLEVLERVSTRPFMP